ncbi:hypothetical protein [Chitinophaga flava]|uniref:Uncharacterized protein n=1 Tax=Chitinophaga flava TaxID=2259036 RepID=A0A365Y1G8_9BACT|nr:hypothetical protein [Chitinophaga flava]RBL91685.1 hypothetical protein DF182_03480 [Chitinophaga flava]
MKTLSIIVLALFLVSCSSKNLTRGKAAELIQPKYPRNIDWPIFTTDPKDVIKFLPTKLEEEGYVIIKEKIVEGGWRRPYIFFTDKSKSYLLETPEYDRSSGIQRVKVAEQYFSEITGVRMVKDGQKAIVEYSVINKNVTPFAQVSALKIVPTENCKAYFALYDDGWRLIDKFDPDFKGE